MPATTSWLPNAFHMPYWSMRNASTVLRTKPLPSAAPDARPCNTRKHKNVVSTRDAELYISQASSSMHVWTTIPTTKHTMATPRMPTCMCKERRMAPCGADLPAAFFAHVGILGVAIGCFAVGIVVLAGSEVRACGCGGVCVVGWSAGMSYIVPCTDKVEDMQSQAQQAA
jgi:hypothetical protein